MQARQLGAMTIPNPHNHENGKIYDEIGGYVRDIYEMQKRIPDKDIDEIHRMQEYKDCCNKIDDAVRILFGKNVDRMLE